MVDGAGDGDGGGEVALDHDAGVAGDIVTVVSIFRRQLTGDVGHLEAGQQQQLSCPPVHCYTCVLRSEVTY